MMHDQTGMQQHAEQPSPRDDPAKHPIDLPASDSYRDSHMPIGQRDNEQR